MFPDEAITLDKYLFKFIIKKTKNGKFVDINTNGKLHNITNVFEKFLDWSGIFVNPTPLFEECVLNRPNAKHYKSIENIDLSMIDLTNTHWININNCEDYFDIIKTIDFEKYKPDMLSFRGAKLKNNEIEYLRKYGYLVILKNISTIMVHINSSFIINIYNM